MEKVFERHEKAAFMFSGGKDSLACLMLLKDYLEKITVIWVNTGDAFPETEEIIRKFTKDIPHFLEVKTDVKKFKETYGMPTDLVPIRNSQIGHMAEEKNDIKLVNGWDCCLHNLWVASERAIKELGVTLVIRGQRNEERLKAPIKSGYVENGIEYYFPIESWSTEQVLEYLRSNGFEPPEFFNFSESSLDCMGCTAHLEDISDRKDYMARFHPEKHAENKSNIEKLIAAASKELEFMKGYVRDEP